MIRKKKGGIEYLSAIMLISLAGIMLLYAISYKEIKQYQHSVKDNLDAACLAAAFADTEAYENDGTIMISYSDAKNVFFQTLKHNMGLGSNYEAPEGALYDSVTVHKFIVYNIAGDYVYRSEYDADRGYNLTVSRNDGNTIMPNGTRVENCTVYADIGMNVYSFAGINKYVHVISSADIVEEQ